jgi:hypothetical protein
MAVPTTASVDLTTDTKVEAYLGLAAGTDEALIDFLIDAASLAIERHCDREFAFGQKTEYHDGEDSPDNDIVVSSPPIWNSGGTALLQEHGDLGTGTLDVYDDLDREFDSTHRISDTDLDVDPEAGVIHSTNNLNQGKRNLKVVYYGGYSDGSGSTSVPPAVDFACQVTVAAWYNAAKSRGDGLRTEAEHGVSVTYSSEDLPEKAKAALAPFRRNRVL